MSVLATKQQSQKIFEKLKSKPGNKASQNLPFAPFFWRSTCPTRSVANEQQSDML